MNLVRCAEQTGTLDEFYGDLLNGTSVDRDIGVTMLDLIERLRALPSTRSAWGLTSHYHLFLLSQDRSDSERHVEVIAQSGNYAIRSRQEKHGAQTVRSADEAVQAIERAMLNSGGWPNSDA